MMELLKAKWKEFLDSIIDITLYYFNEGDLKQAEYIYQHSENILSSADCPNEFKALFYFYYGKFCVHGIFYTGYDPNIALNLLDKGMSFISEKTEKKIYSMLLDQKGMGIYFTELVKSDKDFSVAREILEHTLSLRQEIGDKRLICETLFRLGLIDEQSGSRGEALKKYEDSYSIAKENHYFLEQSYAIRHLGFLHYHKHEYQKALKCLLESRELREKVGFKPGNVFSNISLGDIYIILKNFQEAENCLNEALDSAQKFGIDRGVMLANLNLGELNKTKNENEKAEKYLKESIKIGTAIGHEGVIKMANKMLEELN